MGGYKRVLSVGKTEMAVVLRLRPFDSRMECYTSQGSATTSLNPKRFCTPVNLSGDRSAALGKLSTKHYLQPLGLFRYV